MKIKQTITLVIAFLITLTTTAFAAPEPQKIAVVDIQKVVASSAQVKALKASQEAKNKELSEFIKKAQADVNKQTDAKKKKSLAENYEKQLAAKREANNKAFASRLATIDKSVTNTISNYAKAKGYPVVIAKSVVIYGGKDITNEVAKLVK